MRSRPYKPPPPLPHFLEDLADFLPNRTSTAPRQQQNRRWRDPSSWYLGSQIPLTAGADGGDFFLLDDDDDGLPLTTLDPHTGRAGGGGGAGGLQKHRVRVQGRLALVRSVSVANLRSTSTTTNTTESSSPNCSDSGLPSLPVPAVTTVGGSSDRRAGSSVRFNDSATAGNRHRAPMRRHRSLFFFDTETRPSTAHAGMNGTISATTVTTVTTSRPLGGSGSTNTTAGAWASGGRENSKRRGPWLDECSPEEDENDELYGNTIEHRTRGRGRMQRGSGGMMNDLENDGNDSGEASDQDDGGNGEYGYRVRDTQLRGYGIGGAGNIRRPTDIMGAPRSASTSSSPRSPLSFSGDKKRWAGVVDFWDRMADRKGKSKVSTVALA